MKSLLSLGRTDDALATMFGAVMLAVALVVGVFALLILVPAGTGDDGDVRVRAAAPPPGVTPATDRRAPDTRSPRATTSPRRRSDVDPGPAGGPIAIEPVPAGDAGAGREGGNSTGDPAPGRESAGRDVRDSPAGADHAGQRTAASDGETPRVAGDDPGGSRIVVRGVVRDDRGRPVAGARVTAVRAGDGRTTAAARADERGRFRLVLDGAGRWHVAARTADGSPVDRRLALELRAGDGPLRLGGPRAEGGVPATGDAGSAGPTEATSTASDGQGMTVHVPAVPGDGADHVDLRIVAADDGAGVAGAVVAWAGAGGRDGADRRDGAGGDAGMGGRARADADGTVRVPAGTAITVTAPGRAPGRVSAEDASAAARSGTVVVVPLRRTGVVAGRVLRDGRPVGGAAVTGPGGVRAVSDADGRWRLEGLAPGLVRVHATGPDGRAADARVLLAPAGVIDVDLDLEQP